MRRMRLGLISAGCLAFVVAGASGDTTWTGGGDGTSWADPANWSTGAPNGQRRAFINGTASVTIGPAVADQFSRLVLADGAVTDDVLVTMTGGTLNINSDATPVDENDLELATTGRARFHMIDGTVNMALNLRMGVDPSPAIPVATLTMDGGAMNVVNRMFIGYAANSVATVEMNNGSLTVGQLFLADGVGSQGTLLMTGGTITTRDLWAPTNTDSIGSTAHIQLDGGTINVLQLFQLTNDLPNNTVGTMDITHGTMILAGDLTSDATLLGYISNGLLTGYGGHGSVLLNYVDGIGTQVSAIPEPATGLLLVLAGGILARRRRVR